MKHAKTAFVFVVCLFLANLRMVRDVSWDEVADGEKAPPSWANQVQNALGSGMPVQPAKFVVFYNSSTGTYQTRNCMDGSIDYDGLYINTALQGAVNDLPSEGGRIVIQALPESAWLGEEITVTARCVTIEGEVWGTGTGEGVILKRNDGNLFEVGDADNSVNHFCMRNLYLVGGGATDNTQKGLYLRNADYATVENVRGYDLAYPFYLQDVRWSMIRHVMATTCANNGVSLQLGVSAAAGDASSLNTVVKPILGCRSGTTGTVLLQVYGEANNIIFPDLNGNSNADEPAVGIDVYSDLTQIFGGQTTDFLTTQPAVDLNSGADKCLVYSNGFDYITNAGAQNKIVGFTDIEHHTEADTLTFREAGSIHTNLGASGDVALTLPQNAVAGLTFQFVVMAAHQLQVDPGAAGAIYIGGEKKTDDKYIWADDEAESVKLVADGNGDWIAVAAVGDWGVEA